MQKMIDGVKKLIALEEEMAAGASGCSASAAAFPSKEMFAKHVFCTVIHQSTAQDMSTM